MNHGGVCITAPATPGLLNTIYTHLTTFYAGSHDLLRKEEVLEILSTGYK